MSDKAKLAQETVEKLNRRDPKLDWIFLVGKHYTDAELLEVVDTLLINPNVVSRVFLGRNQLTDKVGVKLAQYIATSSTIEWLFLNDNHIGSKTYLALAAALIVNISLQVLTLNGNQLDDKPRVEAAFVDALRLNSNRSVNSIWCLYIDERFGQDFWRLKTTADELGHPSLQLLLCAQLDQFTFQTARHF
jgi:hypothetical protein